MNRCCPARRTPVRIPPAPSSPPFYCWPPQPRRRLPRHITSVRQRQKRHAQYLDGWPRDRLHLRDDARRPARRERQDPVQVGGNYDAAWRQATDHRQSVACGGNGKFRWFPWRSCAMGKMLPTRRKQADGQGACTLGYVHGQGDFSRFRPEGRQVDPQATSTRFPLDRAQAIRQPPHYCPENRRGVGSES
ncbi:hypothetical protein ACPA9J_31605 [Pseudomonas aeruginosa]